MDAMTCDDYPALVLAPFPSLTMSTFSPGFLKTGPKIDFTSPILPYLCVWTFYDALCMARAWIDNLVWTIWFGSILQVRRRAQARAISFGASHYAWLGQTSNDWQVSIGYVSWYCNMKLLRYVLINTLIPCSFIIRQFWYVQSENHH